MKAINKNQNNTKKLNECRKHWLSVLHIDFELSTLTETLKLKLLKLKNQRFKKV